MRFKISTLLLLVALVAVIFAVATMRNRHEHELLVETSKATRLAEARMFRFVLEEKESLTEVDYDEIARFVLYMALDIENKPYEEWEYIDLIRAEAAGDLLQYLNVKTCAEFIEYAHKRDEGGYDYVKGSRFIEFAFGLSEHVVSDRSKILNDSPDEAAVEK